MHTSEDDRTTEDTLASPLRMSKQCLLTIRDDNALVSPIAIEAAFHALTFRHGSPMKRPQSRLPLRFSNYFILNRNLAHSLRPNLNEEAKRYFHTEFHLHTPTDLDERKTLLNHIAEQQTFPQWSKFLTHVTVDSLTLVSCTSLTFRPWKSEHWEQLWSLKFHSSAQSSIETEFYFTKGFFRVAFHQTFEKVEIPGQVFDGVQLKLTILLPRCSSDLVQLYANMNEYLHLPFSTAFIGVCLPTMNLDIDMNLTASLKDSTPALNADNVGELTDTVHLSAAYSLGHFTFDMAADSIQPSSPTCVRTIDLSPVTPWVFFANRPFLFLITRGDEHLMVGQMLGPGIQHDTRKHPLVR